VRHLQQPRGWPAAAVGGCGGRLHAWQTSHVGIARGGRPRRQGLDGEGAHGKDLAALIYRGGEQMMTPKENLKEADWKGKGRPL
jgi:hypothetical protein